MTLPPLPAIGSARVEIYGAVGPKWDSAAWDEQDWSSLGWIDVTPQSVVCKASWGADDPVGVLTVPAAGSWTVNTYDPLRKLDPSNGSSDYATAIRPGRPLRLSYINGIGERKIVRQGLIDEVEYDVSEKRGSLRGTDMVQLLVNATVAAGQLLKKKNSPVLLAAPMTLRARAQYFIDMVGLTALVPVEATPAGETDPPVGPVIKDEASAWEHILSGALDALCAVWMDRAGVLRFRSFGNPRDTGFQAGGADGIPISTLSTSGSLQGVYTRIVAFDDGAPTVPVSVSDLPKREVYGDISYKRDHPVPDATVWVNSVLADRAGASLQYSPGTLYPQTEAALESILDLGMIDIAHLLVESIQPTIDVSARVLGGSITGDTGTGWTAQLLTYIPAKEWEDAETPEPPEPPVIPPVNTQQVTRTYDCLKDARLALSGSLEGGNGLDTTIPIGYINGTKNRAVLGFQSIPWTKVVSVDKAELLLTVGSESCGAFGSSPKISVARLTGSFTEGTYDVACGFGSSNAVVYPGPSVTSSGKVTASMPASSGSKKTIVITEIARAWFGGQKQNGLKLNSAGEDSGSYTTSIYSRHHGTVGNRPQLRLTLTVEV